jgi:hypothetical protein
LQGSFSVREGMTKAELEYFTHKTEYIIFPIVVGWFAENIIQYKEGKIYLKDKLITEPIIYQVNISND